MSNTPLRIAFYGTQPYDRKTFDKINENFGFEIKYFLANVHHDNLILSKDCQAVCVFVNDNIDANTIAQFKENGVKLIALRCAGFNNVDMEAAREAGIKVVRVPAYSPHAVAEYAVALMLSLNRKIQRASWRTRDGNFSLNGLLGFDMYGKTVGIIGTGKIAKVLIGILRGFGMNILAYDVYPDHAFAEAHGVKYVSLDELYASSDIISLHCPLTPETEYIINRESIAKMKKGVMIINTGRGLLINSEDLIEGLKTHQVGFAALDVYEEEAAYFFKDKSDRIIEDDTLARLLSFNNVIMTSHQAFFTAEATDNIAMTTLGNILAWSKGEELVNEVK